MGLLKRWASERDEVGGGSQTKKIQKTQGLVASGIPRPAQNYRSRPAAESRAGIEIALHASYGGPPLIDGRGRREVLRLLS